MSVASDPFVSRPRLVDRYIIRERPAVMHCTNTFPLISPAAYYAARAEGVTIVQSLRNYRLFCVNACLLRSGCVCEDCLGKKVPWPRILHGCYRTSRTASAVVAAMLSLHRVIENMDPDGGSLLHIDRIFAAEVH